jgi:hypothetical protein
MPTQHVKPFAWYGGKEALTSLPSGQTLGGHTTPSRYPENLF